MQTAPSEPLVRKQIMLSNENLEKLTTIAESKKASVAKIVRDAIDSYEPDPINEDAELTDLVSLLNSKLDSAIQDTEETHAFLKSTLDNLSSRKPVK